MTDKNSTYIDWKTWNPQDFSKTSKIDEAYFNNIIKLLGLKKHSKILEIGFGNGSFMGYARKNNYNCEGVESNENLVDLALQNNFEAYKTIGDINNKKKYDLMILLDVIEHVAENKIEGFFEDLSFYLEDNGSIFLRFPNGSSPLGLANQYGDVTHCSVITLPKLNYWCSKSKLKVTYSRGDVMPFIFKHNYLKMPSRIVKLLLHKLTEKYLRLISTQSKGVLSSNLQVIIKKHNES